MHATLTRCSCGHETDSTSRAPAPPIVRSVVASPGRPLDPLARTAMERRLGHDLAAARVHDDAEAAASAKAVDAEAYAVGSHVVLGRQPVRAGVLEHELAHVAEQRESTTEGPIEIVPDGTPVARTSRVLQRYSHQDCTDSDLRTHIWPADGIAKAQVARAIAAVNATPLSPATEALCLKYFMTSNPDTEKIADVFGKVKAAFDGDSYTYECEDDCDAGTNAYSGYFWDIHLCMNNIRGRANDCIARTIVHEFTHKYAGTGHGWWFGTASCYNGCDNGGCPSTLTASEALDNAYSYAGFAREV